MGCVQFSEKVQRQRVERFSKRRCTSENKSESEQRSNPIHKIK